MDRSSGKRGAGGLVKPRKGYTAFKEAAIEEEQNVQFCNRIGCNGRSKNSPNTKVGSSDKVKLTMPSFYSSNGNEVTGKSSRSNFMINSTKKSNLDSKRKSSSQLKFHPSVSSLSSQSEVPELMSSPSSLTGYQSKLSMKKSAGVTTTETGNSGLSSNVRPRKVFHQKSGLRNQNTPTDSAVPFTSERSSSRPCNNQNRSRYNVRNLKCSSISDVAPVSSSLEPETTGKNVMKKRSSKGESSSSRRGRENVAASFVSPSTSGISISASRCSSSSGDNSRGSTSVWTRSSMNVNTRTRLSSRQNERNRSSIREPAVGTSQVPDIETPFNTGGHSSAWQFSASVWRSHSLSSSNGDYPFPTLPFTYPEPEFSHSHSVSSHRLYRYNMDRIAEVLSALERIEQEEELIHERAFSLETSLFLSSLNLYDQHRDMRLDIDNMSYEELLALEERMGTVSTALSEEELSKCLERSIYVETPSTAQITGSDEDGDDIKCSICQEEYVVGDEMGKLVECQHGHHLTCINQWLQLKNWCPVCKASAAPSHSSSSW